MGQEYGFEAEGGEEMKRDEFYGDRYDFLNERVGELEKENFRFFICLSILGCTMLITGLIALFS